MNDPVVYTLQQFINFLLNFLKTKILTSYWEIETRKKNLRAESWNCKLKGLYNYNKQKSCGLFDCFVVVTYIIVIKFTIIKVTLICVTVFDLHTVTTVTKHPLKMVGVNEWPESAEIGVLWLFPIVKRSRETKQILETIKVANEHADLTLLKLFGVAHWA